MLNKSSCLASFLSVNKFFIVVGKIWSHFAVLLKSDLDVKQTKHRKWFVKQKLLLGYFLGVAKFTTITAMNLVTLCCAIKLDFDAQQQTSEASLLNKLSSLA